MPFLVKASGFNHHTGTYQKILLKKSWRIVDGQKVEKNLHSAFLLSNLAEDMQPFDAEGCAERFPGGWGGAGRAFEGDGIVKSGECK